MDRGPIWVFAGPSLPLAARPASTDFVWRPPAMAGDGLTALEARPRAVVLIDGLFDRYPAIRHKELMALIESGVGVIGAASMGALRAAELHSVGMAGVGAIFRAYAGGRLVRDDEVAVLHGPADMDWAPLTIPLVNVRATLQRAARERVIGLSAARALRRRAADIFYQDRTWWSLLDGAVDVPPGEREAFSAWLPTGYVDLKLRDALEALAVAGAMPTQPASAATDWTVFTTALARQVEAGLKPDLASDGRR